jgi:hypothetical protein
LRRGVGSDWGVGVGDRISWRGRGGGGSGSGLAEDLKHDGATGGTFALNGFAAIFHGFFNAIGDGLFGLALDAVSFRHKKFADAASCGAYGLHKATHKGRQRQFETEVARIQAFPKALTR